MPYPITELFAWVIDDPEGALGILGILMPDGMPMQAVSSKRHVMERDQFRDVAARCAADTGKPVKLLRFTLAEAMEEKLP